MMDRFCIQCGEGFSSSGEEHRCSRCAGPVEEELVVSAPAKMIAGPVNEDSAVLTGVSQSFPTVESVPVGWEPTPGDVLLDLYEVRDELGRGGMGTVHRVHHRGWGLDLAVKSPLRGVEGFASEAEAWVELGLHPHVVTCHYVRNLGGVPRVFAELVEGGSLKEWIDDGRLYAGDPDEVLGRLLDVAIQFAWGLGYAHDQGLVHQDVKPANVLMDVDLAGVATVKVTDFGLATVCPLHVDSAEGGTIVVAGVGGTPAYLSPEQADVISAGKSGWLTRRTDIWSWAVSVLEMFVGERTWVYGAAAPHALSQYLEEGSEQDGVPAMPEGLVRLLRECFQLDPDDRPHDFYQIADQLVELYEHAAGESYEWEQPVAADLLADQLNNKALSLLDLDRQDEAEDLLSEALVADPHHIESTYNRGLRAWRRGAISDLDLVAELEDVGKSHLASWRDEYVLALVHTERGDAESALELLEAAQSQAPDVSEVEAALARVHREAENWCRLLDTWKGHTRHREAVPASPENTGFVLEGIAASLVENMPVGASLEQQDGRWVVEGYDGDVEAVAVSPDGRWVASGSADRTVRIWDAESGECLRTLQGHSDSVVAVAASPDGESIISGSVDRAVRVWDVESGRCMRVLEGNDGCVWSVAVSPDGRWVVSGGEDQTVRVWDLRSGELVRTLSGHTAWVNTVVVSPDGRWVVSGGEDQTVRVWDLRSGELVRTLSGHTGWVWSVVVSPDGRRIVSGGDDGTLRIWDLLTGECVRRLRGHGAIAAAMSPDGRWAVSGGEQTVRVWDVESGKCMRTLQGHTDSVIAVAVSPDGRWAVSGSKDETLRKWRLGFGDMAVAAHAHPQSSTEVLLRGTEVRAALDLASSYLDQGRPDEAALCITQARQLVGFERHPDLLDMIHRIGRSGRRIALSEAWCRHTLTGHTDRVCALAVSPDGRCVVSGGDETVRLWDVGSGQCRETLIGQPAGATVRSVAVSPDGRWIVSGMGDKTIRVWDAGSGECVRTLQDHDHWVSSVAVSPDGRWIVSGSGDKTVRLRDRESGVGVRTLRGKTDSGAVNAVAISPDGRWVVSGSEEETVGPFGESYLYQIRVWDVESGECVNTLQGHSEGVRSVAVSPDGQWMVTGGVDETVQIWQTGECNPPVGSGKESGFPEARKLQGHTGWVSSVAVSPDGRWIVSGSGDKTVRVWDVESGECVRTLQGHTSYVDAAAVSPDGRWIISGSGDETLRVWELDWKYEFPDPVNWDDGALPYLEVFLTLHTPYGPDGFARQGMPSWTDEEFQQLLVDLSWRGYGWLRPEGVRAKLEELVGR